QGPFARWDRPRGGGLPSLQSPAILRARPSPPGRAKEVPLATATATPPTQDGETQDPAPATIGAYLIERLHELGVRHVFGVPGDYILGLYKMLEASPIRIVGTTREDCAGFAADAYARVNGLGCVAVTYCVGGLSLTNSIAGAYAEKSPVVV